MRYVSTIQMKTYAILSTPSLPLIFNIVCNILSSMVLSISSVWTCAIVMCIASVDARPSLSTVSPHTPPMDTADNQTTVEVFPTDMVELDGNQTGILMLNDDRGTDQAMFNSTVDNKVVMMHTSDNSHDVLCQVFTRHVPVAIYYKINTTRILSMLKDHWDGMRKERSCPLLPTKDCPTLTASDIVYMLCVASICVFMLIATAGVITALIRSLF